MKTTKILAIAIWTIVIGVFTLVSYFGVTTEYKYIPVTFYYSDGTKEIVKVNHRMYSDGSFDKLRLSDGCAKPPSGGEPIRCGLKYFRYE